jgi:nucleoid-associated protein YgaU
MIDRYQYTKQDATKHFQTAVISDYEYSESDYYIISREGDRLDTLAQQFYGDTTLWWVIANANNIGKGSFDVPAGMQIRIPFPIYLVNEKLQQKESER